MTLDPLCLSISIALISLAWLSRNRAIRSQRSVSMRSKEVQQSLRHFQAFLDSKLDAVYGIDLDGRCTYCNSACLRSLGYADAIPLVGKDIQNLVADAETGAQILAVLREGRSLSTFKGYVRKADGSLAPVELQCGPIYAEGRIAGVSITLGDASRSPAADGSSGGHDELEDQVRSLSAYSEEMALFGQLTELFQACVSPDEICRLTSAFASNLFPKVAGAIYILDGDRSMMVPHVTWGEPGPGPLAAFPQQDCWAVRKGKANYWDSTQGELCCIHIPQPPPVFAFCLPLAGQSGTLGFLHLNAGQSGEVMPESRRIVAITLAYQVALGLSNIKLKEILREEAIQDPVTGLFNRRFMKESLDQEIRRAEHTGTSLAVIAFDLDHFKDVNDTLGHAAGDILLQELARLAKGSVRAADIACRPGGDEFLLILPDISEADCIALAEGLRRKAGQFTRERFPSLGGHVTLSAGVAMFPQDARTPELLREAADQALYRAKTLGRDRVFAASSLV